MNKRVRWTILGMLLTVIGAGAVLCSCRPEQDAERTKIRVGLLLYRGDDANINHIRSYIEEEAKAYEQEHGVKVVLDISDAKGNQNTQNSEVDRLLSLDCDALCVNMVDRSAASYVINRAMEAEVPVVFFNREPVEEDMKRWEQLYYVGADAQETARLQGSILLDAWKENPHLLDLDQNGTVSYVLLEGEQNHQDTLIRTEWSVQTLKDGGVPLERLTGGCADWERSQASALTEQWIRRYGNRIELIISNNDEMALGAVDALERAGNSRSVKVVGIDGTPQGMEGVRSGKLYGTVSCDSREYAHAVFTIAVSAGLGENVQEIMDLRDGRYYECSQKAITASDLQ